MMYGNKNIGPLGHRELRALSEGQILAPRIQNYKVQMAFGVAISAQLIYKSLIERKFMSPASTSSSIFNNRVADIDAYP